MTELKVIKLVSVLASYFHGYEPRKGNNPRFESSFLLDPSNKAHAKAIKDIQAEAERVFKDKFPKIPLKKAKMGYGENDEDAKYGAGFFKVQAWSKLEDRPVIVNRQREPTVKGGKESVYSGATVNTSVSAFAWEYKDKESGMTKYGVSFNLRPVQFVEATPPFSERPEIDVDKEFEALGDAAEKASREDEFE